jgi:ATP-dependent RNA helicase DDX31/DBP7
MIENAAFCLQVPSKVRLVVLAALLRQYCAQPKAAKAVVFMSSCDAVEFMHQVFTGVFEVMDGEALLPCPIFKLHGNLAQVRLRPALGLPRKVNFSSSSMR